MSKAKRSLTIEDVKTLVNLDTAYKKAKKALDKAKAEEMKKKLEDAGAVVELK